jgi:hypothetical protein
MRQLLKQFVHWHLAILACAGLPAIVAAQNSNWVKTGATGRLIYVPAPDGDRIQEFSMVGYGAGKKSLPDNLPVIATINATLPAGSDYTSLIQNTINAAISGNPIQSNGFRGVVQFGPGEFNVSGHITIGSSGIVLRGSGSGSDLAANTHIVSTNTTDNISSSATTSVFSFTGSTSGRSLGTQQAILDKRVPVGAQAIKVASTAGMAVGGMIEIFRPSTQAWIEELGMDLIPNGPWTAGSRDLKWQRTITRIEGNTVYFDAPITTALDAQWGGGTVRTYSLPNKIKNVGIENLWGQSLATRDEANENRTPSFVSFSRADDGFVRNIETRFFPYATVYTNEADGTQHITVDGAHSSLPSGQVTGGRRYTYATDGQLTLVQNSTAVDGRHDFVTGSNVVGPIAFVNSTATVTHADAGPHHRWGSGLLFDNVTAGQINIQNRWDSGSGHGWAGANSVVWNSTATSGTGYIVQSPPTAKDWLIGSTGTTGAGNCHLDPGVTCGGIVESHGTKVTVGGTQSLYQAQKNDAADIREFHWTNATGNWNDDVKWNQEVKPGVYSVRAREYLVGDYDSFTNDGAADNVFVAPAWATAVGGTIAGFDNLAPNKNIAFTVQHQLAANERVIHAYLAMSMKQGGDEVATDYVRLFDTLPENQLGFASLGWSTQVNMTNPYVGVIDLGGRLDKLQTGSVNVALSDDVGVDWAIYAATVATPLADATGPSVFIDSGNLTVNTVINSIGSLKNGGIGSPSQLTVSPTGRLNIIDDFTQVSTAVLAVGIGGTASGQYGVIAPADQATLAGSLKVELSGGYIPSAGKLFSIINATSGLTGTFSATTFPNLPGDLAWQLTYGGRSVVASITGSITLVGDLNTDGLLTSVDWSLFKSGTGSNFTGLTKLQSYLLGDLDGDLDHDLFDFFAFRTSYDQANGAGAFAQMTGVPEPSVAVMMYSLLAACGFRRRR